MQTKNRSGHFDYFRFNDDHILILCDEEDKIMAFCGIKNNNEVISLFVKPEYRGTGVVHVIVGEVLRVVYSLGYSYAWFTFFPKQKKFYEHFGAKTLPGIRPDGKLIGIYPFLRQRKVDDENR